MDKSYSGDALISLAECIYDIGVVVHHLNDKAGYPLKDSRSLPLLVLEWAEDFEKAFPWHGVWDEIDYPEVIDAYAKGRFRAVVKEVTSVDS